MIPIFAHDYLSQEYINRINKQIADSFHLLWVTPTNSSQSDILQVKSHIHVKQTDWCYILGSPKTNQLGNQVKHLLIILSFLLLSSPLFGQSNTKQWTKQLGTSSDDRGNGVTTDSSGNIFVTGYTWGGLDGNTNSGFTDIFLVKYNSSGIKQ